VASCSNKVSKVLNTQGTKAWTGARTLAQKLSLPVKAGKGTQLNVSFNDKFDELTKRYESVRLAKSVAAGAPPQNQPFYVDVKQNIYSILATAADTAEDAGYNLSVGTAIKGCEDYEIGGFTLDSMTKPDKLLDEYVGVITNRVSNNDLIENFFQDRSEFGSIGRLCMQTLASDYWTEQLGFDPLVPSRSLEISRKEKESKLAFKARRAEFLKKPITRFPRLLSLEIKRFLTHPKAEAHANALTHLLRTAFSRCPDKTWFREFISQNPKLIPTVIELQRLGKIPDSHIKEFKNLFHSGEWKIVASSLVYKAEEEIKEILKKKLESPEDVKPILDRINELRSEVNKDLASVEALRLKKVRLGFATKWRKTLPREVVLDVLRETPKHLNEEKVKETFAPFTLAASSGIRGSDTAISRLHYSREEKIFQWAIPIEGQFSSPELDNLGLAYATFLNSYS